jgi:hypothetical protein
MTITISAQNVEIISVSDVVVTPVVQDTDAGDYVRDIRIFTEPMPGMPIMVLQLRIRAAVANVLRVTSPQVDF